MVNTITKQTINDGERNLIVKIQIHGDGSGEETVANLIDVSTYNGHNTVGHWTEVKLVKVVSYLNGFSVQLIWDATTNVKLVDINEGEANPSWETSSGLINNSGTGKTGDILVATAGLGNGDEGTIVLYMKKRAG